MVQAFGTSVFVDVSSLPVSHTARQLQELPVGSGEAVYHRLQLQHPRTVSRRRIGLRNAPGKFFVGCSGGVDLGLRVCAGHASGSAALIFDCLGSCRCIHCCAVLGFCAFRLCISDGGTNVRDMVGR